MISGTVEINGPVSLVGNGAISLEGAISGGANGTLLNGNASSGNTIGGNGTIGELGNLDVVNGAKGIISASGGNLVIDTKTS